LGLFCHFDVTRTRGVEPQRASRQSAFTARAASDSRSPLSAEALEVHARGEAVRTPCPEIIAFSPLALFCHFGDRRDGFAVHPLELSGAQISREDERAVHDGRAVRRKAPQNLSGRKLTGSCQLVPGGGARTGGTALDLAEARRQRLCA